MNATKRSAARAGLVVYSVLAVTLTGCQTHIVHERTRTVYVPTPPQVVHMPVPAPQPPPSVVVAAPAEIVVIRSENDFYEPLTAYGRWVVVGSYGRCWIPARVETGWRPYVNGHWRRTDAGWYWASEEPWGWATYHYGRWDFHTQFGWIWVPHTQWAPAWVAWREGGGYVGWAPLRPAGTFGVNFGVAEYEPAFASRAFVFVEHRRMLEPVRPRSVIVNNTTIINQTVNLTNVKVVNHTVINEGPRPEAIERASGRRVPSVPVREFRRKEEATVAARQRSMPTASDRKVEPSTRPAPRTVEEKPVPPSVTRPVERPAQVVTQPPQPLVTSAPSTPARPETQQPARNEKRPENEIGERVTITSRTVEPKVRPVARPPQAVAPGRDRRPVEKPVEAANPMPQPVTANPIRETVQQPPGRTAPTTVPVRSEVVRSARDEKKRETTIKEKNIATPSVVAPKPRQEARPETRLEMSRPVRVETSPEAAAKRQAEANKPEEEAGGSSPQGETQATTTTLQPTRPGR